MYKTLRVYEVVEAYADAHSIIFALKRKLVAEWRTGKDRESTVRFLEDAMEHIRDASNELQNSFHSRWTGR